MKSILIRWEIVEEYTDAAMSLSTLGAVVKAISKATVPVNIHANRIFYHKEHKLITEAILQKASPKKLIIEDVLGRPTELYEGLELHDSQSFIFKFDNRWLEVDSEAFLKNLDIMHKKGANYEVEIKLLPDMQELRIARYVLRSVLMKTDHVRTSLAYKRVEKGELENYTNQQMKFIDKNFNKGIRDIKIGSRYLRGYEMYKMEIVRTLGMQCLNNMYDLNHKGEVSPSCSPDVDYGREKKVNVVRDNPFYFMLIKKDRLLDCPYGACSADDHWKDSSLFIRRGTKL